MNYQIVPARPRHIALALRRIKPEEYAEIIGLGFQDRHVRSAVLDCFRRSVRSQAALLDGEVAAVWGLTGALLGYEWGGWLITTPLVNRHPVEFVRRTRRELTTLAQGRPIVAHCAEFFPKGLRFLGAVGFEKTHQFVVAPTGKTYWELRFRMNGS